MIAYTYKCNLLSTNTDNRKAPPNFKPRTENRSIFYVEGGRKWGFIKEDIIKTLGKPKVKKEKWRRDEMAEQDIVAYLKKEVDIGEYRCIELDEMIDASDSLILQRLPKRLTYKVYDPNVDYKGLGPEVDDDDSEEEIDLNVKPLTFAMNTTEDERLDKLLNSSYAPYEKIHSKRQKKKVVKRKKRKHFPVRTSFGIPQDINDNSVNESYIVKKKKRKMKAPIGIPKTFLQEVTTVTDELNTYEENGKFYIKKNFM